MGIDGCSVPTPFLSLQTIAKLFQKLGHETYSELTETFHAMVKHPYLVGGINRFDTDFNYALNGRGVCKVGGTFVIISNPTKIAKINIVIIVMSIKSVPP